MGVPNLSYYHRASLWGGSVANSIAWTQTVLTIIRARMSDFEAARDVESFCPDYAGASRAQREVCWLRLIGGVVEFESSFQPSEKPFYEGNGIYSVGLLALSTGECANAPTQEQLMDPVKNLICGVNKMASLIARGRAIYNPEHDGASAYWSTLRPPHRVYDEDRERWLNLGKRNEIIQRTRLYRQFR